MDERTRPAHAAMNGRDLSLRRSHLEELLAAERLQLPLPRARAH
jgi:hypothetical protein